MSRLPESDYVIALGQGGTIVEQGPFSQLRSADGYIQGLDINELRQENEGDAVTSEQKTEDPGDRIQPEATKPLEEPEAPKDSTIFKYYFAAVRPTNLVLMFAYVAIKGFILTFRCEFINPWEPVLG